MKEVLEQLARIDVSKFPIPMRLRAGVDDEYLKFVIEMDCPDSITGRPTTIFHATHAPLLSLTRENAFVDWVHFCIRTALVHELDEHFRIDGILTFDPHRREREMRR